MDSQTAIDTLQALRNTLASQITGIQGQVDALDVAFQLLKDGYQADQARIDAAVASVTAENDSLKTQLADANTALQAAIAPVDTAPADTTPVAPADTITP